MKCRYAHCCHDHKEIKKDEPYEKHGSAYYHADCDKERIRLNDVTTRFLEQVNNQVSISQLKSVINKLCFDEHFGVDYVEFALDYAITHPEMKLTYPTGMYRICRSITTQEAWKKKQDVQFTKSIDENNFVAEDIRGVIADIKRKTSRGFSSILRR